MREEGPLSERGIIFCSPIAIMLYGTTSYEVYNFSFRRDSRFSVMLSPNQFQFWLRIMTSLVVIGLTKCYWLNQNTIPVGPTLK